MKHIRTILCALLLAAVCLVLLRDEGAMSAPKRLWVGGTELTDGGVLDFGDGTAEYDPENGVLTLTDAEITGDFRGAAIYAEGSLTLVLMGDSSASGRRNGCTVLGDLTVSGAGGLLLAGKKSGAAVHGCLTVFDSAALALRGEQPLKWGKLHVSPMDTVLRTDESLRVCAPYTALLMDGALDAAGHPLIGEGTFAQLSVKLGEPVPEPDTPVKDGYRFDGWFRDGELNEPFDFSEPFSENVALYARWVQLVPLRFDSWGGSETADGIFDWGSLPEMPAEPTREGWRFLGWYADDRLKTEFDWSQPMTETRNAYAKWEKIADRVLSGIDAARYQGEMDWERVRESGRSFVFLRIGYRGYGSEGLLNPDANFEMNYEGAVEAGMDVGVYLFSQATSEAEAREEAQYILTALDGRPLGLPVVMDFELATDAGGGYLGRLYEAGLSGEDYARICLAFCEEIEANGYTAAVYAGQSILKDKVGDALDAAGYPVWLAHWTVQTRYNGDFDYWQTSGSGSVPGIQSETDLDVRFVTAPEAVAGLNVRRGESFNFLFWDKVPGVAGYSIYRSEPGSETFTEVGRKSGAGSTVFTDYGADAGCRYRVCARLQVEGEDYCGPLSEAKSPE